MGLFSGIKKVVKGVGDVFGGVVSGVDKLTGGRLSKLLGNKWVKGALLAVSIVTGGIAIANGVMALGQAGIGAAAKQFATNMSMETGKNLMGTLVEGGKQFIGGVAKGLVDPMGSDAGQAAQGMLDSVTGNITGSAMSSADEVAAAASGDAAAINGSVGADVGGGNVMGVEGVSQADPQALQNLSSSTQVPDVRGFNPDSSTFNGMGPNMSAGDYNLTALQGAEAGGDALTQQISRGLVAPPAAEPGFLQQMASGVKDYATSPAGIQQIGGALQGWASGQALQERWDEMAKAEKQRYRSWTDGSFKMPRFGKV